MSTVLTETTVIESTRDTYRLLRERTFDIPCSVVHLIAQLRMEKCTGTLTIDMSQGGICKVRFREEQDIRYETSK